MTEEVRTQRALASGTFEARLSAVCDAFTAGFSVPDAGLVPVMWEGHVVGRTLPDWAARVGALPGAMYSGTELALPLELEPFGRLMREAGLSQGWRDELLDLRAMTRPDAPPEGKPLLRLERALFRPIGAGTSAVQITARLRAPSDERDPVFLMAKRSQKKLVGPGLWDGLAAGMIGAGETPLNAAGREAMEEAGLENLEALHPEDLGFYWASRPIRHGWLHEASHSFCVTLPEGFTPRPLDGEVECFEVCSAEKALERIVEGKMMKEAAMAMLLTLRKHF
ncbi:NUDIX domain-containing protein [Sutterella sp.]|uniref:NUDIX domain-containing protein n=1 Tax=Sutterella sp. TaxID=1981025 RepID=UPI0026E0E97E|nr:NUDIX domain-containing protein [Sutterella sp.]MDO5530523.1 NUDIX domain-containing protein [Sutterella sp.]